MRRYVGVVVVLVALFILFWIAFGGILMKALMGNP